MILVVVVVVDDDVDDVRGAPSESLAELEHAIATRASRTVESRNGRRFIRPTSSDE
jgi:hypothetical protein